MFANRLEKLLDTMEPGSMSIRVEKCRSIVCEIRGRFVSSDRHRRREIKLLKNLLSLPEHSKLVAELVVGDNSDLADCLILLAILYQNVGFSEKAIHCLEEARELAKKHCFRFPIKNIKTFLLVRIIPRKVN